MTLAIGSRSVPLAASVVVLVLGSCTWARQLSNFASIPVAEETIKLSALNQWGRWVALRGDWYELDGSQKKGAVRVTAMARLASVGAELDGVLITPSKDHTISFRNRHDGQHQLRIVARTAASDKKLEVTERVITVDMRR